MINKRMVELGNEPSDIRELFTYGLARKAAIGYDKVFDFSLGNPSVAAPKEVAQVISDLVCNSSQTVHSYTPASGDAEVRSILAKHITRHFGVEASAKRIYLCAGAAACLSITLSALTSPQDEVVVIRPYFPEYKVWIETAQCRCVEVAAHVPDFQLDSAALGAAITPQTAAVIINSPNNPVGVIYTREVLEELACVLKEKEKEYGHSLYLISDEPYREIVYGDVEVPYLPTIYEKTIVCYSYSKSLSLPGERIGYIYVSDLMPEADKVCTAVAGAGRALGFVCAPSLFQQVVARCVDARSNVAAYKENRDVLVEGLAKLGYEFVWPQGAFYFWMRALEDDAIAFSERAKHYELLLVPSNSFGIPGWVRISYCVSRVTIERSLPAFKQLMESYRS